MGYLIDVANGKYSAEKNLLKFALFISSALSIFISIGTAFCVTHLIFGNIHLITLVFGTSLIGSCLDYTVHYFINWKCSVELDTNSFIALIIACASS